MRVLEKGYLENEKLGLFQKDVLFIQMFCFFRKHYYFPQNEEFVSQRFFVLSKIAFQMPELSWPICSLFSKKKKKLPIQWQTLFQLF